jgi:hypothetical protein
VDEGEIGREALTTSTPKDQKVHLTTVVPGPKSRAPSLQIQPALTIDLATARNGIAVLREVMDDLTRSRGWQDA